MATQVPPKKGTAFTLYTSLVSRSSRPQFQANPTLAAGDVKIAIDDGAPANMATLPAVDADFTRRVKIVCDTAEMNGDVISIIFADAAGDEWDDLYIEIQTTAQTLDEIDVNVDAILADTGTDGVVLANGAISAAKIGSSAITAGKFDTGAITSTVLADDAITAAKIAANAITSSELADGAITAAKFAAAAITAAAIATDAIDADALATDASVEIWASATRTLTASPGPTAAAIADAVWDEADSDHVTSGSFGEELQAGSVSAADIWSYSSRTLTQGAAAVTAAVSGSDITVYRGATWVIALTNIGALTSYDKVYMTVKSSPIQADSDAILQVFNDTDDGLIYFAGAAPVSVAGGLIAIDDIPTGDITITIQPTETISAPLGTFHYDIKGVDLDGLVVQLSAGGKLTVAPNITRVST